MTLLKDRYGHKVKTLAELLKIISPFPREKKVIMCHGVFDVVHPGHLRHLMYAKSRADILIASITADIHIAKGELRPHVPEDLRSINLAAFEMIDYVLIDPNSEPLDTIKELKPDYFAKGYEYSSQVQPKTQKEIETLSSFGGQMIFTPGDVIYSSSRLIEMEPPNLRTEKLLALMDKYNISFNDLRETLGKFKGKKVHVIGDTIIDTLTHCSMIGGQTKTPTMSVRFEEKKDFIGGAAIVARHLKNAGSDVVFSTVLGNDDYKDFVLKELKDNDISVNAIIDGTRPTTNKNAIVTQGYRLLKIDTLENQSISDEIRKKLELSIKNQHSDCIVFSDFRHGIFNRRTIDHLVNSIPKKVYKVADSQVASRWGNITEFKKFDLVTPNEREARFALGDQDSGIRPLASSLYDQAECKLLILKIGDRGVLTCRSKNHESPDSFFVVDSFVNQVKDAVGAGDALLAYSTLAMLACNNEIIATILGTMAAAVECEVDGNIPVNTMDVIKKIDDAEKLALYKS
ncbi:MAG: PfkB family carbohydrate kinase [Pseudomonadota bacterium]|nr:PfkB family carbohydrate kinase [Pseudomonadota bacterium]